MAAVHMSRERRRAYDRAAATVLGLDEPLEGLLQRDGTLRKIANIGPSSTRIILEALRTGTSETVERTVAASPKAIDVERSRQMREHFLSRARALSVLADSSIRAVRREDYSADFQMHSVWSDGSEA